MGWLIAETLQDVCIFRLKKHNPHSWHVTEIEGKHEEYPAKTGLDWEMAVPEGAELERTKIGLLALAWDFRGKRIQQSTPDEIWSFAKLGIHGFRFLSQPPTL